MTGLGWVVHVLLADANTWRPMLDPVPVDTVWPLLLLPLAVAIAVVYKAIKLDDLRKLPRQATVLSAQIVLFMIAAAGIIWAMVDLP